MLNGGGTPIGVVSSLAKAALLNELGVEAVIDRTAEGYRFWKDATTQDEGEWRRGRHLRDDVGLHGGVRQPPLLDEAQAADRQPLRQLLRGVGGQPVGVAGGDPAVAVGRAPAGRDRSAALNIHRNEHEGKIGILCLSPRGGLGIDDPEKRARIGRDKITLFRRHA
jgi:crotonyl-CoA reductase